MGFHSLAFSKKGDLMKRTNEEKCIHSMANLSHSLQIQILKVAKNLQAEIQSGEDKVCVKQLAVEMEKMQNTMEGLNDRINTMKEIVFDRS